MEENQNNKFVKLVLACVLCIKSPGWCISFSFLPHKEKK